MLDGLLNESITVSEKRGEVAGVAQYRRSVHAGSYAQLTLSERLSVDGPVSANAGLVVLDPDGFDTSWSLHAGDTVTVRGVELLVSSVAPIYHPRTLALVHVEASVG